MNIEMLRRGTVVGEERKRQKKKEGGAEKGQSEERYKHILQGDKRKYNSHRKLQVQKRKKKSCAAGKSGTVGQTRNSKKEPRWPKEILVQKWAGYHRSRHSHQTHG
jgi:hypothetical protein